MFRIKKIIRHAKTLISASKAVKIEDVAKRTADQIKLITNKNRAENESEEDDDDDDDEEEEEEGEEDENDQNKQEEEDDPKLENNKARAISKKKTYRPKRNNKQYEKM